MFTVYRFLGLIGVLCACGNPSIKSELKAEAVLAGSSGNAPLLQDTEVEGFAHVK